MVGAILNSGQSLKHDIDFTLLSFVVFFVFVCLFNANTTRKKLSVFKKKLDFPFLPLLTQKCHGEALLLDIVGLYRHKANRGSLMKSAVNLSHQ